MHSLFRFARTPLIRKQESGRGKGGYKHVGGDYVIDARQQFIDLFNSEEMLAFFDFQVKLASGGLAQGLCKVSKPKGGGNIVKHGQYFSLLFLIDTPDDTTWRGVTEYVKKINWDYLGKQLPGIQTVLSIPHLHPEAGFFFKETDVYVTSTFELSKTFVMGKLYPAIQQTTGFKTGELTFWEDLPQDRKDTASRPLARRVGAGSFVERLREFLGND